MRFLWQTVWNVALAALALTALPVMALRSEPLGIEIERREAAAGIDELRVDVAGAVVSPGVVVVAPGERVVDAIERAGGVTADADTGAVNQSRRLVDQDHIVAPRKGERPALLDRRGAGTRAGRPIRLDGRDLVAREVIPARVYEQIRDLVAVR